MSIFESSRYEKSDSNGKGRDGEGTQGDLPQQ
jgi:hypothetical protein